MKFYKILLTGIDTAIYIGCYLLLLALSAITGAFELTSNYILNAGSILIVLMVVRLCCGVYRNVWRYANSMTYFHIIISDIIGGIFSLLLTRLVLLPNANLGVWHTAALVAFFDIATLSSRFIYKQFYRHRNDQPLHMNKIGVAIVGAGQVGALLADELQLSVSSHYRPVCFVDTDHEKIGGRVRGLRVYAEDQFLRIVKELPVQEIFIALPKLDSATAKKVHDYYSQSGCKVKLYDFPIKDDTTLDEDHGKRVLRDFKIEDLLFRKAIEINNGATRSFYQDKVVLVTGGGGSIGSELCRQIAKCHPKQLIVFDIYENNAYDIQQELIRKYGKALNLCVEIGSVRDRTRLEALFSNYRPQIVFHAAAHKHVPLMEHSSCEAIKNNVMGTYHTADMAEKYGVEKFVLISTDKAVNPTNVMGASKRMCEMIVQCRVDSQTDFAAVRFGNVLGSNGSVVPLFQRQIESGGPVTITDKRIIRYFMTIPEASQLVMQAGAMAKKGELFVLDMGKPVKILDLVENMIRLYGLRPYKDIDVVEIGLRPGEKLYEELLLKTETLDKTENNMIFIEKDAPLSREAVEDKLRVLREAVENTASVLASAEIKRAMKQVIPTYRDPDEVNQTVDASEIVQSTVNG